MFSSWLVSLFALVLCAVFYFETDNVKTMSGSDPVGPTFYPLIIMAITAAAALLVLARSALAVDYRSARGELARIAASPSQLSASDRARQALTVGFVMALSLIYPFAMLRIGFVTGTAVFTIILMHLFEQRLRVSIPVSLAMAVGLHIAFSDLLNARIVPGQWFDLMRWLTL